VYGSKVDVLIAVQRLLALGVKGKQVTILCPDDEFVPLSDERANALAVFATTNQGVRIQALTLLALLVQKLKY
jgi:hypothetical protein